MPSGSCVSTDRTSYSTSSDPAACTAACPVPVSATGAIASATTTPASLRIPLPSLRRSDRGCLDDEVPRHACVQPAEEGVAAWLEAENTLDLADRRASHRP